MHIMGCGAFGAKKEDRPEGAPCMYNLLEITRDQRSFKVVSREQKQPNAPFTPHAVWPKDDNENELTAELVVSLA